VLLMQGDLGGARRYYQESLDIRREIGNWPYAALSLIQLGRALEAQGDLPGAWKEYEEAEAVSRKIDDPAATASAIDSKGMLLYEQGDLSRARETFERALEISEPVKDERVYGNTLLGLAAVLEDEGDLPGARERVTEARTSWASSGNKVDAARSQLALAELSLAEGRPQDAEATVRQVLQDPQTAKTGPISLARALLVRALLAEGRVAAAQQELGAAGLVGQYPGSARQLSMAVARFEAASGKPDAMAEAAKRLQAVLAHATQGGYVRDQFEARLAVGEVQLRR